jgi:hypothetical protein
MPFFFLVSKFIPSSSPNFLIVTWINVWKCYLLLLPPPPLPTLPHVNPHSSPKVSVFRSLFLSTFGYYLWYVILFCIKLTTNWS